MLKQMMEDDSWLLLVNVDDEINGGKGKYLKEMGWVGPAGLLISRSLEVITVPFFSLSLVLFLSNYLRAFRTRIFAFLLSSERSCNLISKGTCIILFRVADAKIFQEEERWLCAEICKDDILPILCMRYLSIWR